MSKLQFNPNIQQYTRPTSRGSLDDIRQKYNLDKIYQLSQNENPLGPSPKVIEAITNIAPTLSYYPNFSDIDLRQAIINAIGRGLTPNHIYTGCSGFESLELMGRAFLQPDDEMIVSSPTFTGAYAKVSVPLGAKIVDVPLTPETFEYRVDAVLDAITDKTKIIMVCNPNNPTGTVIPTEKMDVLMAGVPDHVLVVSDEVYHHFVDDATYPDSIKYVLDGKNIVVVHSFSKAYGLAGMRLGYGIAKPEIADYISGLHRGFHQNKVAMVAGIAACNDQEYLNHVVKYLQNEQKWVVEQFDRLDIKYWNPAANFILFETKMLADDLTQKMKERGIILRPQSFSGMPYGMRVSLGTHEANEAFINALEETLGEIA
jgi:histidinol-phosphate aminotransferase